MGGSSPKTVTTTVDPEYNKGLLEISKGEFGMAQEMYNMFKYGVSYDPTATEEGMMIDGQWIQKDKLTKEQIGGDKFIMNPEYSDGHLETRYRDGNPMNGTETVWVPGSGADVPKYILNPNYNLDSRTAGEIRGYDPNTISEMDYMQQIVEANAGLLGLQTNLSREQLNTAMANEKSQQELIPLSTDVQKAGLAAEGRLIPQREAVTSKRIGLATNFMDEAEKGVNVGERMNQAQAEVQHGFKNSRETMTRNLQSYGLDPNSGMFASQNRDLALNEASGIAGARTAAQRQAEDEDWTKKQQALSVNI